MVRVFGKQVDNSLASIDFSPDGMLLATGATSGPVLWNVESGRIAAVFEYGESVGIHDLAFSPDGRLLASGGMDPSLQLWDVESRQLAQTLKLREGLYCVAFSPDGTILASVGGVDNSVLLWDVESGKMLRSLQANDGLTAVAFSPEGTLLAAGGNGNTIVLWGIYR